MDLIIGDPHWMPHPIRLIGRLIAWLDNKLLAKKENAGAKGVVLVIVTLLSVVTCVSGVLIASYYVNHMLGIIIESILTSYILATKSLMVESMKVYISLDIEDQPNKETTNDSSAFLDNARHAVSMIVGRDTANLDEAGIIRATVETIAENTSDGVIAPLIYTCIGGPILGFAYKAINTMDSMVGYHNDRYEDFGRCAARLDDIVNFIPARVSAFLMIAASFICGKEYDTHNAWKIFKRDRFNHKSPNSAQTESVCAGALGLRLAGDAYYFGRLVKKKFIGDEIRQIEKEDIKRACKLMSFTSIIAWLVSVLGLVLTAYFCR